MALSGYFNQHLPTEFNFINKLIDLKTNREPTKSNTITLKNIKKKADYIANLDKPPLDLNHRDIGIMRGHLNIRFIDNPPDDAYIARLDKMAAERESVTHEVLPGMMFRGGRKRRTRKYKK
jgi:hypothetical protein